jgi:DNA polymerase-1
MDYNTFLFQLEMGIVEIKDFRTLGKEINFTATYGAMAKKVAHTLCITEEEAQVYLTSREETFPGLITRIKEWHKLCKGRGYATTMLGGRRHLGGHRHYGSRKEFEHQAADRLAYSMRIQGSAAEMTKLATGKMYSQGLFENDEILPVANIYDEVVLQVRDDLLEERMPILMEIMCQQYADMIVPMETDPEVGKNFGSLKKWKTIQMENN